MVICYTPSPYTFQIPDLDVPTSWSAPLSLDLHVSNDVLAMRTSTTTTEQVGNNPEGRRSVWAVKGAILAFMLHQRAWTVTLSIVGIHRPTEGLHRHSLEFVGAAWWRPCCHSPMVQR